MKAFRVISGGQTGADRGGLTAAKYMGILTGGYAPLGYRTEDGPDLTLKHEFGLDEIASRDYRVRTEANVEACDLTILLGNLQSAGSKLTASLCAKHQRACLKNPSAQEIADYIKANGPRIVNVAGNRESVTPGIARETFALLVAAFKLLGFTEPAQEKGGKVGGAPTRREHRNKPRKEHAHIPTRIVDGNVQGQCVACGTFDAYEVDSVLTVEWAERHTVVKVYDWDMSTYPATPMTERKRVKVRRFTTGMLCAACRYRFPSVDARTGKTRLHRNTPVLLIDAPFYKTAK